MASAIVALPILWGRIITDGEGPPISQNERSVEIALAHEVLDYVKPGWVLDAGCAVLPSIHEVADEREPIARIVHLTQAISSEKLKPRGTQVSFVSADMRDLSIFADRAFHRVACISTLEHVGMNNEHYDGVKELKPDTWLDAFHELYRVTKHQLLITVPYHDQGLGSDRWRYFSAHDLALMAGGDPDVRFYRRGKETWEGGREVPYQSKPMGSFCKPVEQIACLKFTR